MTANMEKRIGCIGLGNMGCAIIKGLNGTIPRDKIIGYDIDPEKEDMIGDFLGYYALNVIDLAEKSDIIILAVKPDIVAQVLTPIKNMVHNKIIVSIAAGITISFLEQTLESRPQIVRMMPNTPALINEGMFVLAPNSTTNPATLDLVGELFSQLGKVEVLPEKLFDAVTAVSGCGPAYGYTIIQAMADGGVKMGLPRNKAVILAAQTILGAAKMVLDTTEDPISLRGKVTSPGGSTIDAVHVLERAGFSGIVMDAIEVATYKSEKLGKKEK